MDIYTSDPTVTDDSSKGYVIGSKWFNSSNRTLFICNSNTAGAASWVIMPNWKLPHGDDNSIDSGGIAGQKFLNLLQHSATANKTFSTTLVSTYSLVYTVEGAYIGGVLAPNGDIHFVPCYATVGQKINTMSAYPFSLGVCCSGFLNKF